MSKRKSVRKHDSEEVQGEGSYVILSGVKVREIRRVRQEAKDEKFDDFEGGVSLLADHILKWNWVDDEGNLLPLPKNKPEVIDELTSDETTYLVNLLMGDTESKNSKVKSQDTSG